MHPKGSCCATPFDSGPSALCDRPRLGLLQRPEVLLFNLGQHCIPERPKMAEEACPLRVLAIPYLELGAFAQRSRKPLDFYTPDRRKFFLGSSMT